MKLYCLPYAGSSARMYSGWSARLPDSIELVPLELPGRGTLCTRPPISELDELMDHLATAVKESGAESGTDSYAIFGHSFGAVLGFELAKTLQARGAPPAAAVIVSAGLPPHQVPQGPPVHTLSDEEFKRHLGALQGTPAELLENDELLALYLPSLRADYKILDTYRADREAKISAPVLALTGTLDDSVGADAVQEWAQYTTGGFRSVRIAGDHFFLAAAEAEVVRSVAGVLRHA
ncbi:alpha/beta fold hydrolase [Streptomyces sp. NPDC005562]|uniref:thioesterase II family protein n=1 Tax=unclassified Streptomyces TaxID=2593676 RepID=UPI0033B3DF42